MELQTQIKRHMVTFISFYHRQIRESFVINEILSANLIVICCHLDGDIIENIQLIRSFEYIFEKMNVRIFGCSTTN